FVGEFGIIILCFGLARAISGKITSPLSLLEQTIQMVGEGKRHITEEFDDSEVGVIGRKFKEMVNNNLELSDRLLSSQLNEREAELLLLQSQINPHFLYNTLDSLYCMAMIHEDDQIAEMVLALSNTFKLSLNNGEKFITVEDSVQRIKEYMKIQNMRFLNRFELKLDISEEIRHEKIINFILQPFIENAMYHGLEPKVGKGSIQMSGWKEENKIIFTIEDDGVGISDLTVLEQGYGIQNVKERIHLIYGDTYGVSVESHVGIGTKITIIIPSEQRGEMDVSISSY
ncbi:MAG: sensor histidine kinase, partial [Lachnospiraceae bacterium]